jgi:L-aspartate oxidase
MQASFDFVVVGAGVAGLRASVELSRFGSVLCLTKQEITESNTQYAQGGIAVALASDDSPEIHLADTIAAGAGLVDEEAARVLVTEGPERVRELLRWNARFDRNGHGELAFTREGAHSRNRVLHADGDSTGREIGRTLHQHAVSIPAIEFRANGFVRDLLLADGRVVGIELLHEDGSLEHIRARAILLATGGMGMVFANTTNPEVATADGPAMALRAGAELADMEFLQFHPTALCLPGAPRFLLSEAMRGEGAYLRNDRGERFMPGYHPLAELAPRDVVARAIHHELEISTAAQPKVYLDVTHLPAEQLKARFPRIYQTCLTYGLDLTRKPLPTRPAAHYAMGGVRTDLDGRTTIAGLYAAGEAACTGVHGANRLASNSLLEGLVFGTRAAVAMSAEALHSGSVATAETEPSGGGDPLALRDEARQLMESNVGIVRDGPRMQEAIKRLRQIQAELPAPTDRPSGEAHNIVACGLAIACSALARQESRGGHYRSDFPARNDADFRKHSLLAPNELRFASL